MKNGGKLKTKRNDNEIEKTVKYYYTNGDIYDGEIKNDKRNGKVKLTYNDGYMYNDQLKNNKINGEGKMTFKNNKKR